MSLRSIAVSNTGPTELELGLATARHPMWWPGGSVNLYRISLRSVDFENTPIVVSLRALY